MPELSERHAVPTQGYMQDVPGDLSQERHAVPEQDCVGHMQESPGPRDYKKLRAARVLQEQQEQIVARLQHQQEQSLEDVKLHIAKCLSIHTQALQEQSLEMLKRHIAECMLQQTNSLKEFAMPSVASIEQPRPIWPSCPDTGWTSGVEQSIEDLKQHIAECLLHQTEALKDCCMSRCQNCCARTDAIELGDAHITHDSKEIQFQISAARAAAGTDTQEASPGKHRHMPGETAVHSDVPHGSMESPRKPNKAGTTEVPGTLLLSPSSGEDKVGSKSPSSPSSQMKSVSTNATSEEIMKGSQSSYQSRSKHVTWMFDDRPLLPPPQALQEDAAFYASTGSRCLPLQEDASALREYEPEAQKKIEKAWQHGDPKVVVKESGNSGRPIEIFFVDMIQYNPRTGQRNKVYRIPTKQRPLEWLGRYYKSLLRELETGHSRTETCEQYQQRRQRSRLWGTNCRTDHLYTLHYSNQWLEELEAYLAVENIPHDNCKVVDVHGNERYVFAAPNEKDFPLQIAKREIRQNLFQSFFQKTTDCKSESQSQSSFDATACCNSLVRSRFFSAITMSAVFGNAIWIAVSADSGQLFDEELTESPPEIQFVEYMFCFLFSLEISIRFCAFKIKRDFWHDRWFCFDASLVLLMVLETVVFQVIVQWYDRVAEHIAIWVRLMRLVWLGRVLRISPEMLVLSKSLIKALRSVFSTFVFQLMVIYVFGIVFRLYGEGLQGLEDESGKSYFGSVATSMRTLFLYGTLLDDVGGFYVMLCECDAFLTIIFSLFIGISSFTVMNMLVGFLCDVCIHSKSDYDENKAKEEMRKEMKPILECYDKDGDERIWREEFNLLIQKPEALEIMDNFGTDVDGLTTMTEMIFAQKRDGLGYLTFKEFLDMVERLRGSRTATVTDIVKTREYMKQRLDQMELVIRRNQPFLFKELSDEHRQVQRSRNRAVTVPPSQ